MSLGGKLSNFAKGAFQGATAAIPGAVQSLDRSRERNQQQQQFNTEQSRFKTQQEFTERNTLISQIQNMGNKDEVAAFERGFDTSTMSPDNAGRINQTIAGRRAFFVQNELDRQTLIQEEEQAFAEQLATQSHSDQKKFLDRQFQNTISRMLDISVPKAIEMIRLRAEDPTLPNRLDLISQADMWQQFHDTGFRAEDMTPIPDESMVIQIGESIFNKPTYTGSMLEAIAEARIATLPQVVQIRRQNRVRVAAKILSIVPGLDANGAMDHLVASNPTLPPSIMKEAVEKYMLAQQQAQMSGDTEGLTFQEILLTSVGLGVAHKYIANPLSKKIDMTDVFTRGTQRGPKIWPDIKGSPASYQGMKNAAKVVGRTALAKGAPTIAAMLSADAGIDAILGDKPGPVGRWRERSSERAPAKYFGGTVPANDAGLAAMNIPVDTDISTLGGFSEAALRRALGR